MDTTTNTNNNNSNDNNNNLEATHHNPISLTSSSKRTHEEICFKKLEKPSSEQKQEANEHEKKVVVEESGRDKLKRHRVEMSGRVWIPDIWGQEDLLKKWIDCTVFDSGLERSNIMSARDALIQEGRSSLSIENSC